LYGKSNKYRVQILKPRMLLIICNKALRCSSTRRYKLKTT